MSHVGIGRDAETGDCSISFSTPGPFERIPALAERLGVAPLTKPYYGRVVVGPKDGRDYDVFELVNALLDKIEGRI